MPIIDIFNDDAFSTETLTVAINEMDHVPGRAGELAFAGNGEGVATTSVVIESKAEGLSLIKTSPRGAPAQQETQDKAKLLSILVPHIKLEDHISADSIQNVRAFGSESELRGVQSVVNQQMQKMVRRHDLTLEHHRLGALRGVILDSDASTLVNLFTAFGVSQEGEVDFELDDTTADFTQVRTKCHGIIRTMRKNAKVAIPASGRVWAFCGDNFFDNLVEHPAVKGAYDGYAAAERRLGDSYAYGVFEFGGIFFENYRGTDDNSTVAVDPDKAIFFWTGVPGMYAEYYAPADFMETVNTIGLPRYAKIAPDTRFNQFVDLHTQQNPLPLCLRPKTLMKAKKF